MLATHGGYPAMPGFEQPAAWSGKRQMIRALTDLCCMKELFLRGSGNRASMVGALGDTGIRVRDWPRLARWTG